MPPSQVETALSQIKHDAEDIRPIEESHADQIPVISQQKLVVPTTPTVTVYIHGYDDKGTSYTTPYGYDAYDPVLDRLIALTGFDTLLTYKPGDFRNIVTITPYYGTQPPDYYTPEDIEDIRRVTEQYGGGIPRYAWIVAKYIKHVMALTGAKKVNLISASMGSLIARWMIEKNVENLAAEKKITKWQSLEGVIRGNKIASSKRLVSYAELFKSQPIDVTHMSYSWIEENLHRPRSQAASSYYQNIEISQITSTKSGKPFGFLMLTTPNDGYQATYDTYFATFRQNALFNGKVPTHTYFHTTHLGLKKYDGAWANIATFLLPHKRVKITLTRARVDDIHERIWFLNKNAEIVFESEIFSPLVAQKWQIEDAISQRLYHGGTLPVWKYRRDHEEKELEQILFDDYVLKDETQLHLRYAGYEIDQSVLYGIHDEFGSYEKLGSGTIDLPLQNGTYEIAARDWSGTIRVEVSP